MRQNSFFQSFFWVFQAKNGCFFPSGLSGKKHAGEKQNWISIFEKNRKSEHIPCEHSRKNKIIFPF